MKLSEIAERVSGKLIGDGSIEIKGISTLEKAKEGDITFYSHPKYRKLVYKTGASAILTSDESIRDVGKPLVIVEDAYVALSKLLSIFHPEKHPQPAIEPSAFLGRGVKLGRDVYIGSFSYIGDNAEIGNRVKIYPFCYIGDNVIIGDDTVIFPHVSIYRGVKIGKRVRIHSGAVIGSDGFGYALTKNGALKIPQVGGVIIGDDVEIGANTTIDRGTIDDTLIGNRVKIDNLVQIGHNVKIGDDSIIVAQVGIAGSARLGRGVMLGGQVGVAGHINIGDGVKAGGKAGITSDVPPGSIVSGTPHMDHKLWLKVSALLKRLPELFKKVEERSDRN